MSIFKKAIKTPVAIDKLKDGIIPVSKPKEEWIWVEGYKGTDKYMRCKGYQYELNKQYDMPEDSEIVTCRSGFHLCLTLSHTIRYYEVGYGNRFFKVRALVRKSDYDRYGEAEICEVNGFKMSMGSYYDKLAAKSIIFLSELTRDEIVKDTMVDPLPEQYQQMAIDMCIEDAIYQYKYDTLVEDGYSAPFAKYIVDKHKFDVAHAVGSQKDLSMDMKVLCICGELA